MADGTRFSNLNPYENLISLVGDDPDDLVRKIKTIQTPIRIINITAFGTKQVAYIIGDIRVKPEATKPKKGT